MFDLRIVSGERHGFTLIELLVVVSIMALLSGMIFLSYERGAIDLVTEDAYELQSVLQRARSKAISTGKTHAVTFHIENAGDGSVLKNASENDDQEFLGRHWYCIIGPDNSDDALNQYARRYSDKPPLAASNGNYEYTFFALSDYVKAVQGAQAGPIHYLSRGVRFLALSDTDELHQYDTNPTYPRPWFGYYDESEKTLYPWGAYNREIDTGMKYPNTGLDYEGCDGSIPYNKDLDTNVNPGEVWGRIHHAEDYSGGSNVQTGATKRYPGETGNNTSTHTHFGFKANFVGPDTTVLPGTKRPLINAYWCDFMIFFNPAGEAFYAEGRARSTYLNRSGSDRAEGRRDMGMRTEFRKTGGFSVTLCRDVQSQGDESYQQSNPVTGQAAYNKFETVEDAFASISPFLRVHVNQITGVAQVRNNDHPNLRITAEDLKQHKPFPRDND